MLKRLAITTLSILVVLLWPINLFFKNTFPDFITYLIPAFLLFVSFILYTKKNRYYLIPILLIGVYEKKLLILPLFFCLISLINNFKKETLSFLIISSIIFLWQFNSWKGQTVFNRDYEGEQLLIRNIHLYPNIPMARMFQNKPKLYFEKLSANFFTLIDLNNYFFANHPAPTISSTQELYKFYWPFLIFLLIGIYKFNELHNKSFIIISVISLIFSLSLLQNYDRYDFVLWFPLSFVIIYGIKKVF